MRGLVLFCGAGGESIGLEKAGIDIVTAIDVWGDACKTYKENHQSTQVVQADVMCFDSYSSVDSLWASPPRVELSVALFNQLPISHPISHYHTIIERTKSPIINTKSEIMTRVINLPERITRRILSAPPELQAKIVEVVVKGIDGERLTARETRQLVAVPRPS